MICVLYSCYCEKCYKEWYKVAINHKEAISILEKFLQTQYDENLFNLLEKMQGDKI